VHSETIGSKGGRVRFGRISTVSKQILNSFLVDPEKVSLESLIRFIHAGMAEFHMPLLDRIKYFTLCDHLSWRIAIGRLAV
jgi:hypothetical protein